MWSFLKISLVVSLLFGFGYLANAEVKKTEALTDPQAMLGIEQVLNVVKKVDLHKMDISSQQTFDAFFNKKNQMNESVQLLENSVAIHPSASAVATGKTAGPKAPPHRSIKAF